ncbi:hypothetical protein L1887_19995 [Cichorium endivia]|nr:hypothetical protein L1887_19995 [Cichorium endivia]
MAIYGLNSSKFMLIGGFLDTYNIGICWISLTIALLSLQVRSPVIVMCPEMVEARWLRQYRMVSETTIFLSFRLDLIARSVSFNFTSNYLAQLYDTLNSSQWRSHHAIMSVSVIGCLKNLDMSNEAPEQDGLVEDG